MLGGRPMGEWVAEYAAGHRHPVNRFFHTLGIPMIALSVPLAVVALFVRGFWSWPAGLFVVGWIFQFVGHVFEGKPPEFFKDWRFLLVGLRWWIAKLRGGAPLLLILLVPIAVRADEVHPTAPEIARLRAVSDPAISSDGRLVAYVVREQRFDAQATPEDGETSGGWSKIARVFVVPTGGGSARAMTSESESVSDPAFSPDGSLLAFLRKEGDKKRLRLLPLDGGESRWIDTGDLEPEALAFTPDGGRVAFLAAAPPSEEEQLAKFRTGEPSTSATNGSPRTCGRCRSREEPRSRPFAERSTWSSTPSPPTGSGSPCCWPSPGPTPRARGSRGC